MRRLLPIVVASVLLASPAVAQPTADAIEGLRSPEASVRRDALQALERTGRPDAAGAVAALATDGDDQIQLLALKVLLQLLLPEDAAQLDARGILASNLAPVRPVPVSAYEPVAAAMEDDAPEVRLAAAGAFAVLSSSKLGLVPEAAQARAARAVQRLLADGAAEARIDGLTVAGRLFRAPGDGPPPATPRLPDATLDLLVESMNRPDPREQVAAMEALGRARTTRVLDALLERFTFHRQNGPPELAVAALDALARLADPSTTEFVRTLATDRWAFSGLPYVSVLFARERLLHDGSTATLQKVSRDRQLGPRARAYLAELGSAP